MKAILYTKFQGVLSLENVEDPVPETHGVVVQVSATGLCRSDWHGWMGHDDDIKLPHVPGHELAGVVVAVGSDVRNFKTGDRVTVPFVCGCGQCRECISGNHQVCDDQSQPGFTHWGSFAEFVRLDHADVNLVKLPESISDISAAALGCRFITAFRAIVDQGKVSKDEIVAIHGCGGVGLSSIMIASALGAKVIAVDIKAETLELAKQLGAVSTILDDGTNELIQNIQDLSDGGVHVSIDAFGSSQTCLNSISSLRKRGKHIQVGLMTGNHAMSKVPMDKVLANELEIIGSHGMQAYKYPRMLEMIIDGRLDPERLVQRTISLEEVISELPAMNQFKNRGILVVDRF